MRGSVYELCAWLEGDHMKQMQLDVWLDMHYGKCRFHCFDVLQVHPFHRSTIIDHGFPHVLLVILHLLDLDFFLTSLT